MPSCSNAQSTNVSCAKNQSMLHSTDSHERILKTEEAQDEEEVDEEDADFNPFVKGTQSQEASSSLSSEVDGVDDLVDSSLPVDKNLSKVITRGEVCAVEERVHGEEEILVHLSLSEDGACEQELQKNATCSFKKRKSALNSELETHREKDNGISCKTDDCALKIGEVDNATKSQSLVVETDDNDAICTRTRARYSLASFTLDELETFLQESDDDDDLQNVDDEEEYRKFLAGVLQGGDDEGLSPHGNENVDDEDEDNDADFEIELEELLESDGEENAAVNTQKDYEGATRRPETRQNRRRKASSQCERKTFGLSKKPLRPILPNLSNGPPASGNVLMPDVSLSFQSSASGHGLVNGFTPQQIGQLHMLIHEHVQLLIQVFSLSVFDPSRQHIASQVQDLLFEVLHKRDDVVSSKSVPYPSICFYPSNVFSSVSTGGQSDTESSCKYDAQGMFLSQSNHCSSEGRCGYNSSRSNSSQDVEGSLWSPFVRGPMISILDVAPLNFVGRFVNDVHSAIHEYRNRYLKSGCDMHAEKEPLFPFFPSSSSATYEISSGTAPATGNAVSTSSGQQQPKKTLAAILVESSMKESIALVPKEIAGLTQRFLPMFNPVLFPHKPPPPAVVNRVLFTDSEDELLALGLLEYNTDWKAIQQRFLPPKSKHQIFVRQKNRCSSKAPENPIKAVRRMKTSPLTAEEIARIHEGFKAHKFDWMSIWQYLVPHRDPSLLPRQWRIALGTQKSYKQDASKREKRRLYEFKRRRLKAAALDSWQDVSDKEGCEDEISGIENWMDDSDVAYVHQAFLADWRPDTSVVTRPESSHAKEVNPVSDAMAQEASQNYNSQQTQNSVCGKAGLRIGDRDAFPFASKLPHLQISSDLRSGLHGVPSAIRPRNPAFNMTTSNTKYFYRPYRGRKVNSSHLVKLAPDLPPVNLPPTVRVVSQTAFKGFQCGTSKIYPSGGGVASHRKDYSVPILPAEKCGSVHPVVSTRLTAKDNGTDSQIEGSGTLGGRYFAEKSPGSDLEMHPLLFQATDSVPYYPLKFNSGTSSSFGFFPGAQPQLNLSLFHRHHQQNHDDVLNKSSKSKGCTSRSSGFDFHPLLQKSNDLQLQTSFDTIQNESPIASCMPAIDTSSVNGKSNELDLDIHLSHASGKEKLGEIRLLEANDPMGCAKNVIKRGTAAIPLETGVQCSQEGEKSPTVSSSQLVSRAHRQLLVSPNNISRCDIDDLCDNSHPEIVMEQEELSDSEEDIEEHVEFECEEMTDSEGENSSGYEQIIEAHDKEISNSAVEKRTTENFLKGNSFEPRFNPSAQADNSSLRTCILGSKMDLSSDGNGDNSVSAWLCLDSRSADDSMFSKVMNKVGLTTQEVGTASEASNAQNVELSCTNKCNEKSKSCEKVIEDRHTVDMVQQLNLGPVVYATPKKPRKHSGKTRSGLNIGLMGESSSHGDNHR